VKKLMALALTACCLGAGPAQAQVDVDARTAEIVPAPGPARPGVTGVLWEIASDEEFADRFLESVDRRHLALADTVISLLRLSEPLLRKRIPDLYVVRDFGPPPGERPPGWAEIRWAGIRWIRRMLDQLYTGRDERARDELDAAMAQVGRPQRAEMGGLVLLVVDWWADRGRDPRFTHRAHPYDPAEPALARASRFPEHEGELPGLRLLEAMDDDPVVRERLLEWFNPDEHGFLVHDFMVPLEVSPDSLVALGVQGRRFDPELGTTVGHAPLLLRRLALDALDQVAPPVVSPEDDFGRRLARLAWWDAARYEARYWPDPLQAPTFAPFLEGLGRPAEEGGRELMRWVRHIHLQPVGIQEKILGQLGKAQEPVVAELVGLSQLDARHAATAGFRMVYTRRPLVSVEGERPVVVAIDWSAVQQLVFDMLAAITGEKVPISVRTPPELLSGWWVDWWADHRDDRRWYRGELPLELQLPESAHGLDFEVRRARVD
jgi:hypothetical protein